MPAYVMDTDHEYEAMREQEDALDWQRIAELEHGIGQLEHAIESDTAQLEELRHELSQYRERGYPV